MLRTRIRPVLPLLAASLVAVALSACGSAGSPSAQRSDEEKRLAFEDCLRDEGLNVTSSADGKRTAIQVRGRAGEGKTSMGGPDDTGKDPFTTCRKRTGWAPSPPTAKERAEALANGLKMARCMRSHGVDMPDPTADGKMTFSVRGDSPAFEAAQRACDMDGPRFMRGGGPGPAGSR